MTDIELRIRSAFWAEGSEIDPAIDVPAAVAEIADAYPELDADDIPADGLWEIVGRHRIPRGGLSDG